MSRVKLYALLGVLVLFACARAWVYFRDPAPRTSGDDGTSGRSRLVPGVPPVAGYKGWTGESAAKTSTAAAPADPRMTGLAEFAGYFAAHGIWCVSDDEVLIPMLAWEDAAGKRNLERHEGENREAAYRALGRLDQNPSGAARGVTVIDSFVTKDGVRRDALVLDARQYGEPELRVLFVVPYRTKADGGFGVYPPLIGERSVEGWGALRDSGPELDAFLRGVMSHEKGFAVWQAKRIDR